MNRRWLAGVVVAVLVCPGAWAEQAESWMYRPSEEILERMMPAQAKETIEKTIPVWLDKNPFNAWADRLEGVSVRDDHVEFQTGDRQNPLIRLRFSDLSRIELVRDTLMGSVIYGVLLDDANVLWPIHSQLPEAERHKRSVALADAFYVLKNYPLMAQREAESFQRTAQWFREQSPRPQLPEEARRFRVQAESAVRDKRFGDAAQRYGDALKVAPWWPEGHFNRALVLAELNRYDEAIRSMKRYLALVPAAANARQAQDVIYAWEDKASRSK